MIIPFEQMPPNARVWVYQAERELLDNETVVITHQLQNFINQWSSHGAEVRGACLIVHNQFIIIASDENATSISGCSIDKSVHLLTNIGENLKLNLIDRNVAFWVDGKVKTAPTKMLKELILTGYVNQETEIFNTTVDTIEAYHTNWKIPAQSSWVSRYFA